jgi:TP901 family phage tail tape measure protein
MTEMAVVTDLEVGDYWDQLPEHTRRASELGVAIKSVYEAETLYYQQGLKTEQAQSLANTTLKMARIAGLDAAEATDKMTAALRGFNMELNEASAEKVADVYSELAAITAADVNEISSAMTKTASIASSAGMEFETTAAFLSQIIETTRESAETAGTAMKTVIARFQELKKAPEEIGEVDGEIVDANAIETALRSVGVALRDSSGQFRDLDDVFLELSSKWDSLDKNTQRYIATIAAGSRQQSRFIAMMSDYSRTQELVTAANNSAGAS